MKPDAFLLAAPGFSSRRLRDMQCYGLLFLGGITFFCLRQLAGLPPGQLNDLLVAASSATCGWSWLLTRALFGMDSRQSLWPLRLVLVLTATGAFLQFGGEGGGPLTHIAGNVQRLVGSTVLLLALAEPLRTWRRDMPRHESRFRLVFAGAYAALVVVSAVWVDRSPEGSLGARSGDAVKVVCALAALLMVGLALRHRRLHPLPDGAAAVRRVPAPGADELAGRIRQLMLAGSLPAEPHLKVADLAKRLDVAEYKVTQCITGAMGYRNFNQMVNHWRVRRAMAMLDDARFDALPVLSIALDCGFGSIGPFNRAFKAETGLTPSQYRSGRRDRQRTEPGAA